MRSPARMVGTIAAREGHSARPFFVYAVPALLLSPHRWLYTLKFRIILLAALTGVVSAFGTAAVVLHSAQRSIEQVVMAAAGEDREQSAGLLGSKVAILRNALAAVAAHVPPKAWDDRHEMARYLVDRPALSTMFRTVFAAGVDGKVLARVEGGRNSDESLTIADRDYFKRAMASDQPVISDVVRGKVANAPIIVIAVPVLDPQGRHVGVLAGALFVQSAAIFEDVRATAQNPAIKDLVIDRAGRIVAHEDQMLVMQPAADLPGLRDVVREWLDSGSPIDTAGMASVRGDHVISLAGIPTTDWLHLRIADATVSMAPVAEARAAAMPAVLGAGMLAAACAGALAYAMTRPISRLRARAETLLADDVHDADWPEEVGEIGELARAFHHVVEQRQQRQAEVQALLLQLEAVLDHAEVGIAMTRDGRFELVSHQFCQIFRCEKTDAIGKSTRVIYPSDEAFAALIAHAGPALTHPGVVDSELELLRHTGEGFWARLRGRAIAPGDVAGGTIWTIEDVTAAREQREQLAYSATHDVLTGLLNRAAFERQLAAATAEAAFKPFCALFIDLDRFKQVNDSGGHAAGDAVLRGVASVLGQHVRKSDSLARLGGDEFAVLLPSCPLAHAKIVADKLCEAVLAYELTWERSRHSVGASVGLVAVDSRFASAADVLRAADSACYEAKRRGRSRVEVFDGPETCTAVHGLLVQTPGLYPSHLR